MSVQIIWSLTNGGFALDEPLDHGNNSVANTIGPTTIYIRHTGLNPITACSFYLRPYSGVYSGDALPISDFNELIGWGNAVIAADFGGFQINQNAVGGFPNASWPTLANKSTVDGFGKTFRTSFGDTLANAIQLKKETYSAGGTDGEIPTGVAPNVRIQARVVVPTSEDVPGVRQFEQVLKFTFTS